MRAACLPKPPGLPWGHVWGVRAWMTLVFVRITFCSARQSSVVGRLTRRARATYAPVPAASPSRTWVRRSRHRYPRPIPSGRAGRRSARLLRRTPASARPLPSRWRSVRIPRATLAGPGWSRRSGLPPPPRRCRGSAPVATGWRLPKGGGAAWRSLQRRRLPARRGVSSCGAVQHQRSQSRSRSHPARRGAAEAPRAFAESWPVLCSQPTAYYV